MTAELLLRSVFLPGLIACGMSALAAAILFVRRSEPQRAEHADAFTWRDRVGRMLLGLGFGVAFVIAFIVTEGWVDWPPHSRWQWLLLMGAWGGIVGVVAGAFRGRWWCTALTSIALAVPVAWMLKPLPDNEYPLLWRIGLGLSVAALFLSLHGQGQHRRGGWMPLALMIVFAAGSIVMIESRFAKLGLITAAMSASCGGALVIGLFAQRMVFSPGPAAVLAATLPTLATLGWFYNEGNVAFAAFLLLAVAPLALWLAELPTINRRSFYLRVLVWLGLVVILAACAVVLSMRTSQEQLSPYDYYSQSVITDVGWEMQSVSRGVADRATDTLVGVPHAGCDGTVERNATRRNSCGWSLHFACWFSAESFTDKILSF